MKITCMWGGRQLGRFRRGRKVLQHVGQASAILILILILILMLMLLLILIFGTINMSKPGNVGRCCICRAEWGQFFIYLLNIMSYLGPSKHFALQCIGFKFKLWSLGAYWKSSSPLSVLSSRLCWWRWLAQLCWWTCAPELPIFLKSTFCSSSEISNIILINSSL